MDDPSILNMFGVVFTAPYIFSPGEIRLLLPDLVNGQLTVNT